DGPFVVLHHLDLERDSRRPRAPELGGRERSGEQQGTFGARARLGQHLSGQRSERESGIDELVRQAVGCESTALADRVEADLLGVADAVVELGEGLAVVEVRGMNDVSGSPQLVGKREESARLTVCVVEEQYLGHEAPSTKVVDSQAVRSASIVAVGTIPSTCRASSASSVTNASACSWVSAMYSAS